MIKRFFLFFIGIILFSSCASVNDFNKEKIEEFSKLSCDQKLDYIISRNESIAKETWYFEGETKGKDLTLAFKGYETPNGAIMEFKVVDLSTDYLIESIKSLNIPDRAKKKLIEEAKRNKEEFIKAFKEMNIEVINKRNKTGRICVKTGLKMNCYLAKSSLPAYINPFVGLALFEKSNVKSFKCNGDKIKIYLDDQKKYFLTYEYFYLTDINVGTYNEEIRYKNGKPYMIITKGKFFISIKGKDPILMKDEQLISYIKKLEKVKKAVADNK